MAFVFAGFYDKKKVFVIDRSLCFSGENFGKNIFDFFFLIGVDEVALVIEIWC